MKEQGNTRLRKITIVYWLLLTYIVAALAWWYIELELQNREMMHFRIEELNVNEPDYLQQYKEIITLKKRESRKFMLEGLTFLGLIIIIAIYVYRTVRNLIRFQQREQNFMMAVTHELKTPIAVAKLNLEMLKKHRLSKEQQERLINMALQETNRLDDLASNILVSAQIDSGKGKQWQKENLNLSELTENVTGSFRQKFPGRNIEMNIEKEIYIPGDSVRLEMLVNNLIGNAIKYTAEDLPIKCSLHQEGKKIILEVADFGPGIPDKEKPHIFKKFYRIGNESTRSAKGTGLGLYLCERIAKLHNGKIEVLDNQPHGSIFRVSFN
jgi:two-component system sensor histidine kinase CiaH